MDVLHRLGDLLVPEEVADDRVGRHVLADDPRSLSFGFRNRLDVADESERRRALRFAELAFAYELDARQQGSVDDELAASTGDLAGVEIYRGLLARCDAVHASTELGDRPLFPRADDLSEFSGFDQAGFADVPEIDAAFLHVLADVLDGDDGTMIVLLHV
jgi:hypothetical protein